MSTLLSPDRWRRLKVWLPPIGWAALIFIFSTEAFAGANTSGILAPLLRHLFPALSAPDIELIHVFIRKLGHFGEYFVLSILVMRAFGQETHNRLSPRQLALGLTLTALYAVSDELHQALVPSRSASIIDVLIDVFGGICGTLWFHLRNPGKNSL
ncbi:MAG: VanZ family protein [Candidatus Binatia bacterium]